ncbi:thiamine transporter 1-like [Metopolophium dirhodum]|uniref:thiamine transporter 1-like n=1 Tax=Metopolophium dirhodum TaxID=44670 RepID=UPI00298F8B59|nr:thiamine transporter 1-like [Metopolophium dirhodum]XP_060877298.1 thiamine transporter 1-like [Metopolophium dirhodum]XP_060877299.1 thiamine transporter 1-like [Metopolophium dirhodum]XP_060877300.1 thiamine transporter 1-like [Metopolophium dirhodum]XP_060877302.1 thiamine transporter 1-like [Metopolophium dirhodum]XP_060877303.1 thiamine transporter 1-like [Metopolophium dirhodum]
MESWKKITYVVAIFMFLIQIRPLEPYLTAYLTGPNGNISLSEVANSLESIRSYSALIATLIMLIISDYLLYKPVVIILTFCSCITYILMAGLPSLTQLKVSMFFYGTAYCTTIVASCYLFACIEDRKHFQKSASIVAVGLQLGKFFGDISGQIIVSSSGGSYTSLPYCNAFAMFLATIWAFVFPPIKPKDLLTTNCPDEKTVLLRNSKTITSDTHEIKYCINRVDKDYKIVVVIKQIWLDFKTSLANKIILKKSVWYIFGMAAYVQVLNNMNVLYSYVVNKHGDNDILSNGFAESMVTLCGALGAYLIGKLQLDWNYYGDIFTSFCSILMGVFMMSCYFYEHIQLIYLSYILYGLVSEAILVITLCEMANHLKSHCYSLVIGFNLLGSLVMSAIMTFFFVQFNFLEITVPGRFLFIGGLYSVLGTMFLIIHFFDCEKENNIY